MPAERLTFNPGRPEEHAGRVQAALERGLALVPALDGLVVLGRGPGEPASRPGAAYRVVATDERRDGPVAGALAAGAVVRAAGEPGWAGLAPAQGPLLCALLARVPDLALHVVDDPDDADELAADDRVVLAPATAGPPGSGPTVVNLDQAPATVDRKGRPGILELETRLGDPVRLGGGLAFSVLVVCTGNMCRSPMAHGVLAQMLAGERVFVYSAGTDAPAGAPATRAAVEAAAGLGADISRHRARLLSAELVADADLVLVMEEYHRRRVLELAPGEGSRVRLLGEYLPGAEPGREIADPVGRPLEVYRETVAGLARALEQVAGEVRRRL